MNTTTKRTLNKDEREQVCITLAEIASASVIKNLVSKTAQETMLILRRELQIDKHALKSAEYIGARTATLEDRNAEIKAELATLEKVSKILRERIKGESNASKRAEYRADYRGTLAEVDALKEERARNNAECDLLYKKLGQTLGNGNDLKNTAVVAIYENAQKISEFFNGKLYNVPHFAEDEKKQEFFASVAHDLGAVVIGQEFKTVRKAYKGTSKAGNPAIFYKAERDENGEIVKEWQEITMRHAVARAVNLYINQYKNKIALTTTHIITGYDEDGHELTIQASALETLGGVDSVESKRDFEILWNKCENILTARQCEILRYILKGYKQSEIALSLGVSESTIANHLAQIRTRMAENGASLKK